MLKAREQAPSLLKCDPGEGQQKGPQGSGASSLWVSLGKGLIPSGKKFAWLAWGQPPPSSRLPLIGTFLEDSPRAWHAAHPHLSGCHSQVLMESDCCQGCGVPNLKPCSWINLGCFHCPFAGETVVQQVCRCPPQEGLALRGEDPRS